MKVPSIIKQRITKFKRELLKRGQELSNCHDTVIVLSDVQDSPEVPLIDEPLAACFRIPFEEVYLYRGCYLYRINNKKYYLVTMDNKVELVSSIKE